MKKSKSQEKTHNTSTHILKKNNLKVTQGRVLLLSYLIDQHKPVVVDDLQKLFSSKIHFTTMYRILDQFIDKKIISQTNFRDGKKYYEYQENHHHHIVCTNCGEVEGVSVCVEHAIPSIIKNSQLFTTIEDHSLEFFSVCKKCTIERC